MILIYLGVVVGLGLSVRLLSLRNKSSAEFFVASRGMNSFVLLMTLFGTHMTAFALLGSSGEAFHEGIGVFGLLASSSALIVPLGFFLIGPRVWYFGKKYGYVTKVQFLRDRFELHHSGLLLFGLDVLLLVPYLLGGVLGSMFLLKSLAGLEFWQGGLLVMTAVLIYVFSGGMRSTAWVNTLQTMVFMIVGVIAFVAITKALGGLSKAVEDVATKMPEKLARAHDGKVHMGYLYFLGYTFIPLSAWTFPHLFAHMLTAKRAANFKTVMIFYPLCLLIVWVPAVLLGVIAAVQPEFPQSLRLNQVLPKLIAEYTPALLSGLLGAGVLAAIMSSLDSQLLSIGTMLTEDVVVHYGKRRRKITETQQVWIGRAFVVAIAVAVYFIALATPATIFALSIWCFSGFAAQVPIMLAALYFKRATRAGVIAAMGAVYVLLPLFWVAARHYQPVASNRWTILGLIPVVYLVLISSALLVGVSLFTSPPSKASILKFFPATDAHAVSENSVTEAAS